MDAFLNQTFHDAYVKMVVYVAPGKGGPIHKNRPFHGFAYACSTAEYHFENNKTITVKQNDIIYLPKNSNYIVKNVENTSAYAINFDTSEDINIPPFAYTPKNPGEILNSFKTAEKAWAAKSPGYYEKCSSELYNILYYLKKEKSAEYLPNSKASILKPALDYINTYYLYENISIPKLAALCGIGEVYFRRIFKMVYGVSPLKYINHLKLTKARELIESREYSIQNAASLCGFFDDSYFSRQFKKEFGECPKDFLQHSTMLR